MICTVFEIIIAAAFIWLAISKLMPRHGWPFVVSIATVLLCACAAYFASQYISVPTTEVTIKALDQHITGENGQVYLAHYCADGAEYPVQDAVEGNWFWMNGNYVWLEESDERLEETVTQEIAVNVPVGFSRKIVFVKNQWKGLVQVDDGASVQTFDTASVASAPIGAEAMKTLMWILERCLVFALVLGISALGFMGLISLISKRFYKPQKEQSEEISEVPVKMDGKLVWVELLRLVGCVGIIALHIAGSYFLLLDPNTVAWNVDNFFHGVMRYGVPIFLMITGVLYFSADKPISIRRIWGSKIPNFLFRYAFWAVVYACLAAVLDHAKGTPLQIAKAIVIDAIKAPASILWYLLALVEILIIIPLVKPAVCSRNGKRICEYMLAVWFIFAVIKRTVDYCWFIPHLDYIMLIYNKIFSNSFSSWIGFSVLGYYLYQYGPRLNNTKRSRIGLAALGVVSISGGVILTSVYCNNSGSVSEAFYNNFSVVQLVWSVSIFMSFSSWVSQHRFSENACRIITDLSSLTLGVYLMHLFFARILLKLPSFGTEMLMVDPLGTIVVRWTLTTVFTFVCVFILRKIPVLRKYVV